MSDIERLEALEIQKKKYECRFRLISGSAKMTIFKKIEKINEEIELLKKEMHGRSNNQTDI